MPEKELPEIPANVRDLYDKGVAALQKNNLDYAVTLFGQAVRLEPAFFDARQALRAAQHRRTGSRSGGLFKKFMGSASSLTKGQLALRNNPAEALIIAEEALNDDPSNQSAHQLLADAAMALDLPKTAALSLDIVFKNNPKDRRLASRLAEALAATGQRARAERIYRDLLLVDPTDAELNEKLKNLLASRTLVEGRYDTFGTETSSYRDLIRDKEEAVTLEQEARSVKDTDVADRLIQEYEGRLANEGDNLKLMRDTAGLYDKKRDYAGAIRWYQRILEVGGIQDPLILKAIQDARLAEFEVRIAAVPADAPDREATLAALQQEKQAFLLEDARRRADANPTDLQIRYELGELFLQAGRIGEAIAELQKAQNNPNRRIPAMSLLAQCFAHRGMNDLAARKLQEALKEKLVFDEEKKDLHYQLGLVLEKTGRTAESIEQFKTIYESDIEYRDVAARVDAYYASQG